MLSLNDWPLKLDLRPSSRAQLLFLFLALALMLLLAHGVVNSVYFVLAFPLLLIHLGLVWRRCLLLEHSESIRYITCSRGKWKLSKGNGKEEREREENFELRRYFLSSGYICMYFKVESQSHLKPGKTIMVCKDQVSEEEFRKLFVCLKLQRKDLFEASKN